MAKNIGKLLKKLCLAFIFLYGLNFILGSLNIFIPINLITLTLVTLLGIPGLLGLILIFLII